MRLILYNDNGKPLVFRHFNCEKCKNRVDGECVPLKEAKGDERILLTTMDGVNQYCICYEKRQTKEGYL